MEEEKKATPYKTIESADLEPVAVPLMPIDSGNAETKLNNMFAYCNNLFKKKSLGILKETHYKLIDYVKIEKNNEKYNPKYIIYIKNNIKNEEWKLYQNNKNDLENPKKPANIKKCLTNIKIEKNNNSINSININKCIKAN
jgi:tRNA nucleotidyltransferase/poly(A) polymerase